MRPRIVIRKTREVREREERWAKAEVARRVAARTLDGTLHWTHNWTSGEGFWTCKQGRYGMLVSRRLVADHSPLDTPHQLVLQFFDLEHDTHYPYGWDRWWEDRWRFLFEVVGEDQLATLQTALQERRSEIDRIIESMLAELEQMSAA